MNGVVRLGMRHSISESRATKNRKSRRQLGGRNPSGAADAAQRRAGRPTARPAADREVRQAGAALLQA